MSQAGFGTQNDRTFKEKRENIERTTQKCRMQMLRPVEVGKY